jgi:hypothetical protein
MNVHEEGATGDNLGLPLPARKQSPLRALGNRADGPDRRDRGNTRQHPAHRREGGRTGLVQRKAIGHLALDDTDTNRLKLKLTHRIDLSDPSSADSGQSRKLRLYAEASAFS